MQFKHLNKKGQTCSRGRLLKVYTYLNDDIDIVTIICYHKFRRGLGLKGIHQNSFKDFCLY